MMAAIMLVAGRAAHTDKGHFAEGGGLAGRANLRRRAHPMVGLESGFGEESFRVGSALGRQPAPAGRRWWGY